MSDTHDTLVFFSEAHPFARWRAALTARLPDLDVVEASGQFHPQDVNYALVWKPPAGFFARFDNLRLVVNLGAGVDALLGRGDLPALPITRISDPQMAKMMAGYVLFAALRYAREIPLLEAAQRERKWQSLLPRPLGEIRVGVLGLGELGSVAASQLAHIGFDVRAWSRNPKTLQDVRCCHGPAALGPFLAATEILVVMLPLTKETRGLLDARRLGQLPQGAKVINPARGAIIDEGALIEALAAGHLGGATLDTFEREPLPPDNPLWTLPNVLVTPHHASHPIPESSAEQIVDNITRIRRGDAIRNQIDRELGY